MTDNCLSLYALIYAVVMMKRYSCLHSLSNQISGRETKGDPSTQCRVIGASIAGCTWTSEIVACPFVWQAVLSS